MFEFESTVNLKSKNFTPLMYVGFENLWNKIDPVLFLKYVILGEEGCHESV